MMSTDGRHAEGAARTSMAWRRRPVPPYPTTGSRSLFVTVSKVISEAAWFDEQAAAPLGNLLSSPSLDLIRSMSMCRP